VDGRHAKGVRTRQRLTDAALRLFEERGYSDTTVDDIVAEAGMSQRTFFHHFPTKEAVLFEGHAERLDAAIARLRAAPHTNLSQALREVGMSVVDSVEGHPELFLQRLALYRDEPALRAVMLRINEEWIDGITVEVGRWLRRDPTTDPGPRLAATLVNAANRVALDLWSTSSGTVDLRSAVAHGLEMVEPALDRIEQTR
jgi:AcrR family transcriptional regulator